MSLTSGAAIITSQGEVVGEVLDVSTSGIGIRTKTAISPGEFVRLRFCMPWRGKSTWFDPDAVVVRAQPESTGCTWGLSFLNLDPSRAQIIAEYVSAQVATPERRLKNGTHRERRSAVLDLLFAKKKRTPPETKVVLKPQPVPRSSGTTTAADRQEIRSLYRAAVESLDEPAGKKKRKKR